MDFLAQMEADDAAAHLPPEPRPEGLLAREPQFLTDYVIGRFLRRRLPNPDGPQFVACSPDHEVWLVRWPSRAVRWETRERLEAKGYAVPDTPLVAEMESA